MARILLVQRDDKLHVFVPVDVTSGFRKPTAVLAHEINGISVFESQFQKKDADVTDMPE